MMRRHELDPVSLTFGFIFTGLGLLFLLGRAEEALRLRWAWPLLLLALGAGILLDVVRTRRRDEDAGGPDDRPEPALDDRPEQGPDDRPEPGPDTDLDDRDVATAGPDR